MSPGQPTYNATLTMRIEGGLDAGALHAALDTVVQRHEALRTVGVERQRCAGSAAAGRGSALAHGCRRRDGSAVPTSCRRERAVRPECGRHASCPPVPGRTRAARPDLRAAPHRLRRLVARRAVRGADGGLQRDGRTTRAAARRLAIQYGDYARWQQQRSPPEDGRSRGVLATGTRWCRLRLDLPHDLPRHGAQDHRGERIAMDGAAGVGRRPARAGPRRRRDVLHGDDGCWRALLFCRLPDRTTSCSAVPVANRQRPELDALIGFFVNTVVLRVRLEGDPTFRELLRAAGCRHLVLSLTRTCRWTGSSS